jgi:hypothetical protein
MAMKGLESLPLYLDREGMEMPITPNQLSYITDDEILAQFPIVRGGLMHCLKDAEHWFYDEYDQSWINMEMQK